MLVVTFFVLFCLYRHPFLTVAGELIENYSNRNVGMQMLDRTLKNESKILLSAPEGQRFYEQRDAVAAALPTLSTDLHPVTANDFDCASQCIKMLSPFHAAAVELSHEKRVSGSKLKPLIKMLKHALAEMMAQNSNKTAKQLNNIELNRILNETQAAFLKT